MGSRVSLRIGGVCLLVLGTLAFTPIGETPAPDFGQPLAGLPADLLERFDAGKDEFQEVETVEEGLGPVFNDVSCGSCHITPAIGGGSTTLETRFGKTEADGKFDAMPEFGGSLIQVQGIGASGNCEYLAEIVPPEATITASRRTTPLFGLGLVDAVPDRRSGISRTPKSATPTRPARSASSPTSAPGSTPSASSAGSARTRRCFNSPGTPTSTRWASRARSSPTRTVPRATVRRCPATRCRASTTTARTSRRSRTS